MLFRSILRSSSQSSQLSISAATCAYANLKTQVDLIHVDDLVNLIIKAYHCNIQGHKTFLVGSQNITIGIHQDGQRNVRPIGIAWIVLDFDCTNSQRMMHLVGCQASPVGTSHGMNQIIYEFLDWRAQQLFPV